MYDEIGKKIKMLAKVSFYIMAIIIGVVGIVLTVYLKDEPKLVLLAIFGAGLAIFFAWISTFMVYGFGELIDRACNIDTILLQEFSVGDNERIKKLKRLLDKKMITEDEFQNLILKDDGE